ncbi:MAG: tetratricopeptide repeat protein [Terracidiphilus sp.]
MRRSFSVALSLTICLAGWLAGAGCLPAQTPAADAQKKPPAASQTNGNPFPGDTSSVPVLPSRSTPAFSPDAYEGAGAGFPLPGTDRDPVRSPDELSPASSGGQGRGGGWSSSLSGLGNLLPQAGDGLPPKKRKERLLQEPVHQETASEDINVGNFYLDTKDWKGALSRFESALVLAPENPEVYWGLAECQRHMGDFIDARANYLKVIEYDPDSRRAKDARKALKDPALANALQAAPAPAAQARQ